MPIKRYTPTQVSLVSMQSHDSLVYNPEMVTRTGLIVDFDEAGM